MKAPKFWKKRNLISYLLLPLSLIYLIATALRNLFTRSVKINKPVICVGNLVAGGAGKTPIAIALGKILKEMNYDFAYLSRGYGGKIKELTLVSPNDSADLVGDEPILLSEIAPTFIAKNRLPAAKKIAENKDLIILDDGLQNPQIHKDFSILVIDGIYGLGNGFLMPAGPLRQGISKINQADLTIIIGEDRHNIAQFCHKIIFAKIKILNGEELKNARVIGFCGIGRPDKFFSSLKETGAQVIKTISYFDHYLYKDRDLEYLTSQAKQHNAKLITTKKDWVRLNKKYQNQISYLDIAIELDEEFVKNQLIKCLKIN